MSLSKDLKANESALEKRLSQLEIDGNNPFRVLVDRDAFYSVSSISLSLNEDGGVHIAVHADSHEAMAQNSPFYEEDYDAAEIDALLTKLIDQLQSKDLARSEEYAEWSTRISMWLSSPNGSLALRVRVRPNAFTAAAAKLRQ